MSWLDRLTAGFKKTADKVGENITGLVHQQALDTATLDDIEEALIASDLGPAASKRIREAIARQKFETLDERGLRTILAEEIEKILAPVAKPLDVWGFPRPHVILVIGVNGSGKTTTIGKLGHYAQGAGLWRDARRRRYVPRRGDRAAADLGRAHRRAGDGRQGRRRRGRDRL